jgi:hypothetical protein
MASGALNPIENPQAWDFVLVGQTLSPGLAEVGKWVRKHDFQIKSGKGTVGATVTFIQKPPAQGTIKFKLWLPEHFVAWETFRKLLKYDPTKKVVQAIDLWHPSLADIDIKSVVVTDIGNMMPETMGSGLWSCEVSFLEYFPPGKKSAVSTPNSSQSAGSGTTPGQQPTSAQDADELALAAALKKAAAT